MIDDKMLGVIKNVIGEIRYKPGWTFWLSRYPLEVKMLYHAIDPDSGRLVEIGWSIDISDWEYLSFEEGMKRLMQEIWKAIEKIECHERMEYLRVCGSHSWEPHPPGVVGEAVFEQLPNFNKLCEPLQKVVKERKAQEVTLYSR